MASIKAAWTTLLKPVGILGKGLVWTLRNRSWLAPWITFLVGAVWFYSGLVTDQGMALLIGGALLGLTLFYGLLRLVEPILARRALLPATTPSKGKKEKDEEEDSTPQKKKGPDRQARPPP
jgi:hypothetical protein